MNLIKKAQQHKLLMKIWMMLMIQQKKLPSNLKENSSRDGLKSNPWLDYDQENNTMKCSLCE